MLWDEAEGVSGYQNNLTTKGIIDGGVSKTKLSTLLSGNIWAFETHCETSWWS